LDGNGGDDFTFTFPSADSLYAVFAFGFDILDNSVTVNETLSIYGSHSRLIGKLDFGSHDFGGADVSFVGFVSDVPIRYASFDESEADDEIGLAVRRAGSGPSRSTLISPDPHQIPTDPHQIPTYPHQIPTCSGSMHRMNRMHPIHSISL
jgi:hypothetical protein